MNYEMNVIFKSLWKTQKRKQLKKMKEIKIMLEIITTPYATQIYEISKMVIHNLWPSSQDKITQEKNSLPTFDETWVTPG